MYLYAIAYMYIDRKEELVNYMKGSSVNVYFYLNIKDSDQYWDLTMQKLTALTCLKYDKLMKRLKEIG